MIDIDSFDADTLAQQIKIGDTAERLIDVFDKNAIGQAAGMMAASYIIGKRDVAAFWGKVLCVLQRLKHRPPKSLCTIWDLCTPGEVVDVMRADLGRDGAAIHFINRRRACEAAGEDAGARFWRAALARLTGGSRAAITLVN